MAIQTLSGIKRDKNISIKVKKNQRNLQKSPEALRKYFERLEVGSRNALKRSKRERFGDKIK